MKTLSKRSIDYMNLYLTTNNMDYITINKHDFKILYSYYNRGINEINNLQEQLHQASLDIQELTEKDIGCPSWCDKLTNLQEEINKLTAESTEWESRCYKLQEENEDLRKNQRYYKNGVFSLEYDKETLSDMVDDYKSRIDKAVEYIKFNLDKNAELIQYFNYDANFNKLLNILNGDDE